MTQPDPARAQSFGAVAADYDRLRPTAPPEAVAWLVPPPAQHSPARLVLDLAAGTGIMTRALLAAGHEVVAVEPDAKMRAVLTQRSPEVRALAGVGEAIPLPDASVDAVVVASAWHWMDPQRAVPEIARVLRPGGRFAVVWTSRDTMAPWIAALESARREAGAALAAASAGPGPAEPDPEPDEASRIRRREVRLPDPSLWTEPERAEFVTHRSMSFDDFVAMYSTYSQVIIASPFDRQQVARRFEAAAAEVFGAAEVREVPFRARCWRADLR